MKHTGFTSLFIASGLGLAVSAALGQQGQQSQGQASQAGQQESVRVILLEYDDDSNMNLSQQEFEKLYEERLQQSSSQGQGQSQSQAQGQGGGGQRMQSAQQLFEQLDANSNREVSAEELAASNQVMLQLRSNQQAASSQGQQSNQQAQAGQQRSQAQGGQSNQQAQAGQQRSQAQGGQSNQQAQAGQSNQQAQSGQQGQSQQQAQSGQQGQGQDTAVVPVPVPVPVPVETEGASGQGGASSQLEQIALNDPGQLEGESIYSSEDELLGIGEIQQVVRSRSGNELHAVVSSEEPLEIDDRAAVPLSEFRMQDGRILYSGTEQEFDRLFDEPYQEAQYQPVDETGNQQAGR